MPETLRTEERQGVLVVTLDRPDRLNAINTNMYRELGELLDDVREGRIEAGALVLTGEGRAFAAGADIEPYQKMSLAEFRDFQRLGREVMNRLERLAEPVIAAVNGYAFGGGFELALACDVIVASEDARFALPEAKLGLLPGGGGTQRLVRVVGPYVAKRMILAAETIGAQRAYELNLVTEVVAGDALEAAIELAQRITSSCAPLAVSLGKRLIDEGSQASLATALSLEMDSTALLFTTEDKREGIQAFIEKRRPNFEGQ